jgi:hypothetical protein
MYEMFGQYKIRKCKSGNHDVTLHFEGVALEHLEFETAEEAENEYNLIRRIVKHAAGQIKLAEEAGVAFGKKHT